MTETRHQSERTAETLIAKTRDGWTTLELRCLTEEQKRTVAQLVSAETNPDFAHVIANTDQHFTIGHRCWDLHGPCRSHCAFLWTDKDGHVHYEQIFASGKVKTSVSSR